MVVDPFHDLIQGVLQGHALAQQLRNESQQQEMYQRSLARSQEDDQLRDMEVRQRMATMGRPVTGNMVQDTVAAPDTGVPLPTGAPQTIGITRPVDKSRLLKYKDMQVEAYTPEEFATRAAQMQEGAKNFQAMSDYQRTQHLDAITRATQGIDPPAMAVAFHLWPAGRKVLPGPELENLQKATQSAYQAHFKTMGEGQTEMQQYPFTPEEQAAMPSGQPGAAAAPAPGPPGPPAAAPSSGPTPFGSGAPMVNAPAGGSAALTGGAGPLTPAQQDFVNKTSAFRNAQGPSAAPLTSLLTPAQQNFVSSAKAAGAGTPAATAPAATAPGAQAYPRVVFQGGVKGDLEEKMMAKYAGDFKNLDGSAKTFDQLTGAEADTLMARFKRNNKDPVAVADLAARLADARSAREQAQQYRETTHQDTLNNQAAQRGQQSYEFQQRDTAKTTRAVEDAADSYQKLKDALNQNTIQADAVIAPMLLKLTAGGAGSGVRMTEAELGRVFGGRGKWQELQAKLSRYNPDSNKAIGIPDVQRQQIRNLVQTIGQRIDQKTAAIQDFQQGISDPNNNDPVEHRRLRLVLENNIRAIDSGKPLPAAGAPGAAPGTAPAAAAKAPAGPAPNPAAAIAALPRAKTRGQQATETIVEQYGRAYGNDKAKTGAALTAAGYTGF